MAPSPVRKIDKKIILVISLPLIAALTLFFVFINSDADTKIFLLTDSGWQWLIERDTAVSQAINNVGDRYNITFDTVYFENQTQVARQLPDYLTETQPAAVILSPFFSGRQERQLFDQQQRFVYWNMGNITEHENGYQLNVDSNIIWREIAAQTVTAVKENPQLPLIVYYNRPDDQDNQQEATEICRLIEKDIKEQSGIESLKLRINGSDNETRVQQMLDMAQPQKTLLVVVGGWDSYLEEGLQNSENIEILITSIAELAKIETISRGITLQFDYKQLFEQLFEQIVNKEYQPMILTAAVKREIKG